MTKAKAKTAASKSKKSKPVKPAKLAKPVSKAAKPATAKPVKASAKPAAKSVAAKPSPSTTPAAAGSWSDSIRKALQEKSQRGHGPQQAHQGGNGPGGRRDSQSKGPAFFQHRSSRAPG
jgi:hypothetical protein